MSNKESIKERYAIIKKELDQDRVKLVAVSKNQPIERILELFNQDQKKFGENKVQELVKKYESAPKEIEWHMIGHLQTNKVKYIAPFVGMIQSVDSAKLFMEIDKQAKKNGRVIDVLLQIHIAREETKYGFTEEELAPLLQSGSYKDFRNVRICGFMGMATLTADEEVVKREFSQLKNLFDQAKEKYFTNEHHFSEVSMGMSGDFRLAIKCGSTMVRLGSIIFGER